MSKRPFIPPDKPRSWVIMIISNLMGLAAGALGFIASWLDVPLLLEVSRFLLIACVVIGLLAGVVFVTGALTGRYKGLEARAWQDQVW